MAKKPTPHPYADKLTFDRIMLLIATLVNHPGIGHSDTETSDSKYHDALLEVQSQLQKIAAEFSIEFPENYPATPTIRKDLETLHHYGILDRLSASNLVVKNTDYLAHLYHDRYRLRLGDVI